MDEQEAAGAGQDLGWLLATSSSRCSTPEGR